MEASAWPGLLPSWFLALRTMSRSAATGAGMRGRLIYQKEVREKHWKWVKRPRIHSLFWQCAKFQTETLPGVLCT